MEKHLRALAAGIFGVLAVALMPVAALSGPYEDGLDAYNRGDYAAAANRFRLSAEQGHAGAQNNLGYIYDQGRGVLADDVEAVKWYQLAA